MIDPLSGNHVQFPVSNRSTAHNSEWNANLPSRWPFGWSPFPCRARNRKFFNDTRCCDARHKREKIVETDKANNVRGDNSPSFLPCWFPRRVKLEIDVLKKKKRKNWRLKFHSFPAEENRWMAALIVPSRIFGYAPLRVCVWEAFVVHTNCVRLFASWPTYLGDTFPVYSRRVCVSYATPVEKRSGDSSSPPRCLAVHEQVFVANYTGDLFVLIN